MVAEDQGKTEIWKDL